MYMLLLYYVDLICVPRKANDVAIAASVFYEIVKSLLLSIYHVPRMPVYCTIILSKHSKIWQTGCTGAPPPITQSVV